MHTNKQPDLFSKATSWAMYLPIFWGNPDKGGEAVIRLKVYADGNVFCGVGRDGMVLTGGKMGWTAVLEKSTPGGFAVFFY